MLALLSRSLTRSSLRRFSLSKNAIKSFPFLKVTFRHFFKCWRPFFRFAQTCRRWSDCSSSNTTIAKQWLGIWFRNWSKERTRHWHKLTRNGIIIQALKKAQMPKTFCWSLSIESLVGWIHKLKMNHWTSWTWWKTSWLRWTRKFSLVLSWYFFH